MNDDIEFYNRVKKSLDTINTIQEILKRNDEEEIKRYADEFKTRGGW